MVSSATVLDVTNSINNRTVGIVYGITATNTKDSLRIQWHVVDEYLASIQGFMVRYQAVGSTVVQYSHHISPKSMRYEIMQLHENTYYDVCIQVYTNLSWVTHPHQCIKATTSTDSLSVALGSTFGAFLALGMIVFFVFIAKWNHNRKMSKELAKMTPGDSYESVENQDADIEMSDVSLQVHEDQAPLEAVDLSSSHSSNPAAASTANGVTSMGDSGAEGGDGRHPHRHHHRHHHSTRERGSSGRNKLRPALRRGQSMDSGSSDLEQRGRFSTSNMAKDIPEECELVPHRTGSRASRDSAKVEPLPPPPAPAPAPEVENPFINPDGRPPDVRPKNSVLLDMGNTYANPSSGSGNGLDVGPHAGLRPNLSCPNWLAQS